MLPACAFGRRRSDFSPRHRLRMHNRIGEGHERRARDRVGLVIIARTSFGAHFRYLREALLAERARVLRVRPFLYALETEQVRARIDLAPHGGRFHADDALVLFEALYRGGERRDGGLRGFRALSSLFCHGSWVKERYQAETLSMGSDEKTPQTLAHVSRGTDSGPTKIFLIF